MRQLLALTSLALLTTAITIAPPRAQADAVVFTCTGDNNTGGPCLVATPTAPNVTFPGPTLDTTWNSQTVDVTLPTAWKDTDSFSWLASNNGFFIFDDSLNGISTYGAVTTALPPTSGGTPLSETGNLSFAPTLSVYPGTELGTLTGDGTSYFAYDLNGNDASIQSHDSSSAYFGGAGAIDASGNSWIVVVNYSASVSQVNCPPLVACNTSLNGSSGTLQILYGPTSPNYGNVYLTGTFNGSGYIQAVPGLANPVSIVLDFLPAGGSTEEYLGLVGTALPPPTLCIPGSGGTCTDTGIFTPGVDQYNSFNLDWAATISTTNPFATVPEPDGWMLLPISLAGLVLRPRSKRRSLTCA